MSGRILEIGANGQPKNPPRGTPDWCSRVEASVDGLSKNLEILKGAMQAQASIINGQAQALAILTLSQIGDDKQKALVRTLSARLIPEAQEMVEGLLTSIRAAAEFAEANPPAPEEPT